MTTTHEAVAGNGAFAGSAVDAIARIIVQTIEHEGNTKAIFGDPVKLDNHTFVPVATIEISLGGGGGGGTGSPMLRRTVELAKKLLPSAWAAGGGVGIKIRIRPIGFLRDEADGATFVPIAVPVEERHR